MCHWIFPVFCPLLAGQENMKGSVTVSYSRIVSAVFLTNCRELCHHLMAPLEQDIIQAPLLTTQGDPHLHRLPTRYVS